MPDTINSIIEDIRSVGGESTSLTVQQKQWLGEQVVSKRWTVTQLALRVGIRHRLVKRYAHKVRK